MHLIERHVAVAQLLSRDVPIHLTFPFNDEGPTRRG